MVGAAVLKRTANNDTNRAPEHQRGATGPASRLGAGSDKPQPEWSKRGVPDAQTRVSLRFKLTRVMAIETRLG